MSEFSIAIVGATGLVGTTLLSIFEERKFPIKKLFLVASQQSMGKELIFRGQKHAIHDLATFHFQETELSFFCVSNDLAAIYIPKATAAKNIVIDKSHYRKMNIIANPNCNTIPLTVALKPIYDSVGITRINVATYQAVSGTGKEAILELTEQTKQLLAHEAIHPKVYSQQIAFNVLPYCDDFQANGYTREEMKMVMEMQKIFNDFTLPINPTAVRVPVFCGHAASIHLETRDKITAKQTFKLLSQAPGIKVLGEQAYPTPVQDAAGHDEVFIGRIREDISHERGLNLWVVTDNLRKGAALNAVQIAEQLIKHYL